MRFKASYIVLVCAALMLTIMGASSCKKTKTLSVGGELKFSDDTLHFDTVFTAAGSFTRGILIYNPQSDAVVLSSVRLQSGNSSYFHLNVDGFSGNNIPNVRIPPHDSIYVFATVKIDPTDTLTPFIVTDQLIATLNGKDFSVPLTAYGQNAHYIVSDSITANTTWLTDKPYVVLHTCVVGSLGAASPTTLTIPRKCRVYMHQDARFVVFGKMNVGQTGAEGDSVVFQGDRLDRVYFGYIGYPGEWCGLWFAPGSVGNISNTVLKNCGGDVAYYNFFTRPAALRVDTGAVLNIDHSVVKNSVGYGIYSWQGKVVASNCLVATTGAEALAIVQGGYDSIVNCTFANYGGTALTHANNGTVAVLNYFNNGDGTWQPGNLDGIMRNCLVYGSLDSEVICDSLGGATAAFRMDHCLLKMGKIKESFVHFTSCIFKNDPLFKDQQNGDFHLKMGSPAIDSGVVVTGGSDTDLDGKPRIVGPTTDIGCYESQ